MPRNSAQAVAPFSLAASDIAELVGSGGVSPVDLVEAHLGRVRDVEPQIGAMLTVVEEEALADARDLMSTTPGCRRALQGVPIAIKDNICTRGIRTTCGSRILERFVPPYDATVVQRLRDAGAIVIGKTNLDEFAMGSSTENSAFGATRNPWDTGRVPGGSSGGSAAAVAALETPLALGSDTGGSIRQPASLCGVVGLKPTYGLVSRYGLVAYASSLDQIGPIARNVRDAALLLSVIAGPDPHDATCAQSAVPDYVASCGPDIRGLRVGVPREYYASGVDPRVASAVRNAVQTMCSLGAVAEECSMPATAYCLAAYYIIAPSEASSNLARYDGIRYGHRSARSVTADGHVGLMERTRAEGFGAEVIQRIMVGTYALSAGYYDEYYGRAQQVRTLIGRDFQQAFSRYDILVTPTSPVTAFRLGERSDDPLAMKLADVCTLPANMAGVPGISVPCGFADGLPIGLQMMAAPFAEATLFRAAYAYEQATEWRLRRPPIGNPGVTETG